MAILWGIKVEPGCTVSMLSLVANFGLPQAEVDATAVEGSHDNVAPAVTSQDDDMDMAHDQLHVGVDHDSSGELCQPSTPIRREDSLPVRVQEEQAVAESLFAAMYEQTNVLLRNLHFERLNRRATSA